MAILKQRLSKRNAAGGYDPVYLETSSDLVLRPDGTNVEDSMSSMSEEIKQLGESASQPTDHASSHAADGSDPVTPESIGAAAAAHNHDDAYAAKNHGHTAADVGAAATDHKHDASTDLTGVLPINRGGTGATSAKKAVESLGCVGSDNPTFTRGVHIKKANIYSGNEGYLDVDCTDKYDIPHGNRIGNNNFTQSNVGLVVGYHNTNTQQGIAYVESTTYQDGSYSDAVCKISYEKKFWEFLKTKTLPLSFNTDMIALTESASDPIEGFGQITAFDETAKTVTVANVINAKFLAFIIPTSSTGGSPRSDFIAGYQSHIVSGNPNVGSYVIGNSSIALGGKLIMIGEGLLAEGYWWSDNSGGNTHEDLGVKTILGTYNKKVTGTTASDVIIVGGGASNSRANCFRITKSGVYATGNYNSTGADYAEYFEWADGNPEKEDRVGRFVALDGDKIRLAAPADDFVLGIISGMPGVVGDVYDDQWQGMYETDVYGRFIWEDAEIPETIREVPDPENPDKTILETVPAYIEHRMKVNPNYNPNEKYIPRSERPEWGCVGFMGKLVVMDDGTCQVNGWATTSENGVATASSERTKFRVMRRIDENHIYILAL